INRRNPIPDDAMILNTPDAIYRYLCNFSGRDGKPATETSFVRTSLCGNVAADAWNEALLSEMGLPISAFPEIVPPGTLLGNINNGMVRHPDSPAFNAAQVVAGGTHDTAGAFAALKMMAPDSIVLSSGTWNLMAAFVDMGIIDQAALDILFSKNLGIEGARGSEVVIRNIRGAMLVDSMLAEFKLGKDDHDTLFTGIDRSDVPFAIVDIGSPHFTYEQNSANVSDAVTAYCNAAGWEVPQEQASIVKSVVIGMILAMADTARAFIGISNITGVRPRSVLVGGGLAMNNDLMMQGLADALNLPVVRTYGRLAGFGNAAIALKGLGIATELDIAESLLAGSSGVTFEPDINNAGMWVALYSAYRSVSQRLGGS
ncbi:MAG: FGGY-family carbohydrate kinase, partial [Candidatus Margulisiibacteriota bacterium]